MTNKSGSLQRLEDAMKESDATWKEITEAFRHILFKLEELELRIKTLGLHINQ